MTSEELFELMAERDLHSEKIDFLCKNKKFVNLDFLSILLYHCEVFSEQGEFSLGLELCRIALWILSGVIKNDFLRLHFLFEEIKLLFKKNLNREGHDALLTLIEECRLCSDDIKGSFLLDIGILYQEKGCLEKSFACFKEARDAFEEVDDDASLIAAITNLGVNCCEKSKLKDARKYFREALGLAYKNNETENLPNILLGIGYSYDIDGKYSKAKDYYSKALSYSEHDRLKHAHLLYNLAFINKRQEDYELSFELYRESAEILREMDIGLAESYYHFYRGTVLRYASDVKGFFKSWSHSLHSLDRAGKGANKKIIEFYIRDLPDLKAQTKPQDSSISSSYYFARYFYRGKKEFSLAPYKEEWKKDNGKSLVEHIENYKSGSPGGEYNILVSCLKNLGHMHLERNNYKRALSNFRETLSLEWKNRDFSRVIDTLEGLGRTYRALKNEKHSLVFYSEAAHRSISSQVNKDSSDFDIGDNWLYFFLGYPEFAFFLWRKDFQDGKEEITSSASNQLRLARLYQSLDLDKEASFFIDNATKE